MQTKNDIKYELFLIFLGFCLGAGLLLALWQRSEQAIIDKYERMLDIYVSDIAEDC